MLKQPKRSRFFSAQIAYTPKPMRIAVATAEELPEISALILSSFERFLARTLSEEGRESFRSFANLQALEERSAEGTFFTYKTAGKIQGALLARPFSHLAMLFVGVNQMKKGIGTALLKHWISVCNEREIHRLTVNAAPSALAFYKKHGFEACGQQETKRGIVFTPMKLYFHEKAN